MDIHALSQMSFRYHPFYFIVKNNYMYFGLRLSYKQVPCSFTPIATQPLNYSTMKRGPVQMNKSWSPSMQLWAKFIREALLINYKS